MTGPSDRSFFNISSYINYMVSKKRILIIGINFKPELTGIGKYTGEMVDWLIDQGNEITVITGFPYYPYWKVQAPYSGKFYRKETFHDGRLVVYRCPFYVPNNPTGIKRQIHEASLFLSAFFMMLCLTLKKRHDHTICIAPPFHLGIIALVYKFFKGTPIIYHIQDLQIDAAQILGLIKRNWVLRLLFRLERYILNKVDLVTTISEGMQKKVQLKTAKKIELFPNWVDTKGYYPTDNSAMLRQKWNYKSSDKIVVYSGSIGEKQGLEILLQIAKNLEQHSQIKFIICGFGPFKQRLKDLSQDMELTNLEFLPLQSNEVFNDFLNLADVHLVLQKSDASDLVMPSKLTTILAVGGLALVTANEDTTLHDIIINHKMGYVIAPDNPSQLEIAILKCCTQDFSIERKNARLYAETHLDRDAILFRLQASLN
jgi:colanic acid biosynthesis glycosyl transferase WcaI